MTIFYALFSVLILRLSVDAQFGTVSISVDISPRAENMTFNMPMPKKVYNVRVSEAERVFHIAFCVRTVNESENVSKAVIDHIRITDANAYGFSLFCGRTTHCPANMSCVPVSECPLLEDLMDFSCFSSDRYFHRLNSLTCGNSNDEDYVCCPSCDCGRVYPPGTESCGKSMVQGTNYSGIGAHPWVARIGFTNKESGNVRFACSGSIIAKRVVLTAAHCALAKPEGYKLSTVVIGEWDISRSPDCNDFFCAPATQAIKVESVSVHPGYEQKIFRHDIAMIVLKDEMKYSVTAAPICLNDKPEIVINERASLVGWGKLSGQNNLVGRQQQLDVPLVSLETCERIFGESVPIHEGQLCAGGEEGKDACSGFGGAPLTLQRDGQYTQIGIVSFGSENCGTEGVPSVYTNIAHYHKWIVDNLPS